MSLYKKSVRSYVNIIKGIVLILVDVTVILLAQEKHTTFWITFGAYNFLFLSSFSDLLKFAKDKSTENYLKYPQVVVMLVLNAIITIVYLSISIIFRKKDVPLYVLIVFGFFFLCYAISVATLYTNVKKINEKEKYNYMERKYFQNIAYELERINNSYTISLTYKNKINEIIDFIRYDMQVTSSENVKKQEKVIAIAISKIETDLKNSTEENLDCLLDGILSTLKERENILKTEV